MKQQSRLESHKLRVVHLTLQLQTGGMEKLLVEYARHADRKRFDLHFISLRSRGTLAGDIEACGWPVTALETPPGLRLGLVWQLARFFRRWKADVVHSHNNAPLIYGSPAARLAGVAGVIHTRHGRSYGVTPRQISLFRVVSRLADRIVCVSEDTTRLSSQQGIAPNRLCRQWNGIDVSRFSYSGPQPGGPAVLVARLSPGKDVETLLRATALAVRAHSAFRLKVAGDGPCLGPLRRLSSELGLDNHVQFLGEVRDVPALLAGASLFVLPSLSEGISLTLLEAMARGLPVVATPVGGNPEVVVDGQTGFLVPTQAPAALAEKMLLFLKDPERSRQMGKAGRRRVEDFFNVRLMVQRYEELYRQVVYGTDRWADNHRQSV
jgi:glycosyltransferase involved in cell wall biosynthesis